MTQLVAANADSTSSELYPRAVEGANQTCVFWVRLTVNPATEDVDIRLEGRPDSNAEWYEILQVNNASGGWFAAGGSIRTNAFDAQTLLPQMRVRIVEVSASTTQQITTWIQE